VPSVTPIILALGLGLIGWLAARSRGWAFRRGRAGRLHSLPAYHGWFVAICIVVPAALFALAWANIGPSLAMADALKSPVAAEIPAFGFERDAIVAEATSVASGQGMAAFNPLAQKLSVPLREARNHYDFIGVIVTLLIGFVGGAAAFLRLRPDFTARTQVERLILAGLIMASLVAILTTFGILASLIFETARFFQIVNPADFLFGTH